MELPRFCGRIAINERTNVIIPSPINRRCFLGRLASAVPAAVVLPASLQSLLAASAEDDPVGRLIESIAVLKVTGPGNAIPGLNRQWHVNPSHLYPERRPPVYRENPQPSAARGSITHNYVRIRTRNGLEGLYGLVDNEAIAPVLEQLRSVLIGQDALNVEKLWDLMYRSNRHARAGHFMMAISCLDCALWDWRGKYYDAPVYELLGGATRKTIKACGSTAGFSAEPGRMAAKCAELLGQGFDYQKWFFTVSAWDGAKGLNTAIDTVRILREAIGPDGELMFDAFSSWDLPFARQWARAVERYRPAGIEEPFPVADLESYKHFRGTTTIPVATGEHLYNRWEVQQFLSNDAAQIIQTDPEWCGGVSELVKICHLASIYGAKVVPQGHNIHAALHVVASQSPAVCPMVEYFVNYMPDKTHFQKEPPLTDNGWIGLPTRPGFGIELDENQITRTEVLPA